MKKIILASASPRRYELLKRLDLKFEVIPSSIKEDFTESNPPENMATMLAEQKALEVAQTVENAIVIGADTVVVFEGRVLGKPVDEAQARGMLKRLSGNMHQVITGIALVDSETLRCESDYEKTYVKMKNISEKEIDNYIRTGEPMDKAGAYGIQGKGGLFVKKIEGCYFNVVGLPIGKLYDMLKFYGINIL